MPRVVVTGGPGAGKTTLLHDLAIAGYETVTESAREVITERLAQGLPPRPDPGEFAREILRRDHCKYLGANAETSLVFFDRSPLEAIAMLHEASPLGEHELRTMLQRYSFHPAVLLLPPWSAIYRTDAERDHSFAHAERVYGDLQRWYRRCGYDIHEVPRLPRAERVAYVLKLFERGDAQTGRKHPGDVPV